MKVRTLAGLAEYEDVFDAQQDLRDLYASGYVFEQTGDVYDAIAAPTSASLSELAQLGIDVAKIYVAANGQPVRYTAQQTATGTRYVQKPVSAGLFDNPMLLAGIGILAYLALKG